ncbi:hypothetical protein [Paenibacillus artemisiicola]|nr:hypothetical protein [Paenibacillus artemisiicola]
MWIAQPLYGRYAAAIAALPPRERYAPGELLVPELLVARAGPIEMYYAPHNEIVNPRARVMIVGITPGWRQMEVAIRTARRAIAEGDSPEAACGKAKQAARFAGPIRDNLLGMLDELKLSAHAGLPDVRSLFEEDDSLLHTTSLLRYPAFVDGRNYDGHRPGLSGRETLRRMAEEAMSSELGLFDGPPLIVPLGRTVEGLFRRLADERRIDERRVLWGFPHPSGANGHRRKQFERGREEMERRIAAFFESRG